MTVHKNEICSAPHASDLEPNTADVTLTRGPTRRKPLLTIHAQCNRENRYRYPFWQTCLEATPWKQAKMLLKGALFYGWNAFTRRWWKCYTRSRRPKYGEGKLKLRRSVKLLWDCSFILASGSSGFVVEWTQIATSRTSMLPTTENPGVPAYVK